jgi:hypothetical protein
MLQTRTGDVGVVFRRGPSKWVEVIRWEMVRDRFERGHWFHGRIYHRRGDLSPDGVHMIYFVSKFSGRTVRDKEYTYAWTAVSKPPWLTALALWPKGDCWWGGGTFVSGRYILLNHRPEEATPHPQHAPPRSVRVDANPDAAGEDDPLYSSHLLRDGWMITQAWDLRHPTNLKEGFRTITPEHRDRHHRSADMFIRMERSINGTNYRERFQVRNEAAVVSDLEGVEWANWDSQGRLIFLLGGAVWAAPVRRSALGAAECLIDLTGDEPEERVSPPDARVW